MSTRLTVKRLSSGYWHVRGQGPCNWTQVPHWPASESDIRAHAHPEASEQFIRQAARLATQETKGVTDA